jgi:hypothetical protein
MPVLFAFAAALQFNDPDPVQWVAIYATACVLSLFAVLRRRVAPAIVLAVALVAIAWAAAIAFGGPAISEYEHMFDAWEMKSPSVEEAREASGPRAHDSQRDSLHRHRHCRFAGAGLAVP